jgi:pre-mRNA cleavage complex 2 protein Pcf11
MFDANMLNILNSLAGAGGLSMPGSTPRTPEAAPIPLKVERTRLDDYEDMVLGLNLSLSNLDMNRYV